MPVANTLVDLLRRSACHHPSAVAVVDGADRLTYAELDQRSDRIASLFVSRGVGRGERVALFLEKSPAAVAGIWGVLKAGAAYVPIDASAPVQRGAYITDNCRVSALITSVAAADSWTTFAATTPSLRTIVVVDADTDALPCRQIDGVEVIGADAIATAPPTEPVSIVDQDVAYILYTSGSTGRPKGVTLTHRNAMAFVCWAADEFGLGPDDRLSSHAPFHFDLSVFDLFAAAWAAARVVLVPRNAAIFPVELSRFLRDEEITTWYSVPSALSVLATHGGLEPGDFPRLRTMLFAGEVMPTKYLRTLVGLLGHVRFANLYGPTETNVCTWYDVVTVPADDAEPIPIGRSIPTDAVEIVTDDGRRAEDDEIGELYVRGATVMRGYWANPERTEASLVPDPFADEFPDPVYRTGDLVRRDGDGNIHYIGRRDSQIKSRGYRIEIGEIESALYSHPSVVECAVVAIPDDMITNRIRAYVVTDATVGDLTAHCAGRVPKYMVPHQFQICDQLPKTSTGKIDRQGLVTS